ncbi:MAG: hypothetical protein H0X30_01365 [Anaerolineae bacterium]|nr:hypothetical protein [Anaerolineae bacterium]
MTDRRPNKKPEIVEKSFTDPAGIPRVSLLPKGETDGSMGIPVSLDISSLYSHMPTDWLRDFTVALHAQGLIKPEDFFRPGASDRYKAAVLMVIRSDFLSIQALAKEESHVALKLSTIVQLGE